MQQHRAGARVPKHQGWGATWHWAGKAAPEALPSSLLLVPRPRPQSASLFCPAAGSDLDVMANLGAKEVPPLEKQRRRLTERGPASRGNQRGSGGLQHSS